MTGRILIGTSSWTDPTLVKDGHFYPPDAKSAEGRLRFYASKFPIVEVDSTYYFPPSESNSVLWIERTPPEFTFNIKAYSLLTNHPTKRESLYKDLQDQAPADKKNVYREQLPNEAVDEVWQRFRDALMPPLAAATADDIAMIRFHGRDRDVWERKGIPASERFRYDYKRDELEEWVPKVEALAAEARETHVLMNNCYQDYAVRSARELGDLLDLELPE